MTVIGGWQGVWARLAVRDHPPLDPSTVLRVSNPAPGEGITLTLLGEPTALALSRLGVSTTLKGEGMGQRPPLDPSTWLRVSGPPPGDGGLDPAPTEGRDERYEDQHSEYG